MSKKETNTDWQTLKQIGMQTIDYSAYLKLSKIRKKNLDILNIKRHKKIKLAIMGSANIDFFAEPMEFALESLGIDCEIYTAPFNTYAYQMLDPASPVSKFKPDVAFLVNTPLSQPEWPDNSMSDSEIYSMVKRTTEHWINLCSSLHTSTGCEIMFDNFFQLPWKPNGNLSSKQGFDFNNYILQLNSAFARAAPSFIHIHDVAWMAAYHGISNWFDLKYWYHAKLPISLNYIVPYLKNAANIISSLYGGTKKVMVLDLDNTLWGGVIGDDGLDGIRVGQGTPLGEAFLAFQKYIKQLKERGVILAVCSKNDEVNAKLPFEQHPEMYLKLEDFVCFEANWEPKPDNLLKIANKLNLGIDSFVFVDDNPAERELMRAQLPDVVTIEMGEDPKDYPAKIDEQSPFELTSLSNEDLIKTEQYKENTQRENLKTSVTNYNEYLASLEQKALIRPFEEAHLDRITQLINKTNQFNLTTLRKNRTEVETIMNNDQYFSCYIQLEDKFGDNGIIAVLFGTLTVDTLELNAWLMSCRVFKRGVEKMTCNYLVERARVMGKKKIIGNYIPTDRNSMVQNLFSDLGFKTIEPLDYGATRWMLDVETYQPSEHTIAIKDQKNDA